MAGGLPAGGMRLGLDQEEPRSLDFALSTTGASLERPQQGETGQRGVRGRAWACGLERLLDGDSSPGDHRGGTYHTPG